MGAQAPGPVEKRSKHQVMRYKADSIVDSGYLSFAFSRFISSILYSGIASKVIWERHNVGTGAFGAGRKAGGI